MSTGSVWLIGPPEAIQKRGWSAVSEILFEPLDQIELGEQASVTVNVGSTVRTEMNVSDAMKSRYVGRSHLSEKLPLSGQNIQAIDLGRCLIPLIHVQPARI